MKNCFLFIILFFGFFNGKAAEKISLVKSIPINASLFTTDLIGNCYVVKNNNTLIKYNANGDSVGVFNEIKKGKITHIDATNPLRILVYFANYNQIVLLDNMLSKKNTLKLNQLNFTNVTCMANSIDGTIWLYDLATATLLKIDDNLKIKWNNSLRNILEENINPSFMIEQDRNLFLIDSTKGFYKFDLYGFYQTTYRFFATDLQCFNSTLVYFKSPYLISYNTQSLAERKIELPDTSTIIQVKINRERLFVLRKNSLDFYSINN